MKPILTRRGSVLVVVLVMIAFSVLTITRLVEGGGPDLLLAVQRADRERLRADAQGALETTLAVLMDFRTVDGGLFAPAQGWGDPLVYARLAPRDGVAIQIGFEDESAKLPLPTLSLGTLKAVLEEAGMDVAGSSRAADALFAWMHEGHAAMDPSARAEAYGWTGRPVKPPFRSPRSFEELAHVAVAGPSFYRADGEPTPELLKFKQLVSLYRFSSTNLNAAGAPVLLAAGWDATRASAFTSHRAGQDDTYLRNVPESGVPAGFGANIQALRINITARKGAARFGVSALVTWDGQAVLPSRVAPAEEKPTDSKTGIETPDLKYPFTILEFTETADPAAAFSHAPTS